jgi:hypothetical protein
MVVVNLVLHGDWCSREQLDECITLGRDGVLDRAVKVEDDCTRPLK